MANGTYGRRASDPRYLGSDASTGRAEAQTTKPSASNRPAREFIDARGSIDSRTFSEEKKISSTGRDKRTERNAVIDLNSSRNHWRSRPNRRTSTPPRNKTIAKKPVYGAKYLRISGGSPNKFGGYTANRKPSTGNPLPVSIIAIAAVVLSVFIAIILLFK